MVNSASGEYREKRQIVIQNVESAVFYDSGDSEDKRTELVLLEAEIAKRISNGETSNMKPIEAFKTEIMMFKSIKLTFCTCGILFPV